MPTVAFVPPPPESPETKKFRTHANYVRAFAMLAGFTGFAQAPKVLQALAQRARAHLPVDATAVSPPAELVECLHRAWATELLQLVTHEYARERDVIRLANAWSSIHAYYALYGMAQAVIVAGGESRPTSHWITQSRINEFWRDSGVVGPWAFSFDGQKYVNAPRPIVHVHAWQHCDPTTAWDIAASALRSTYKQQADEARKAARQAKADAQSAALSALPSNDRARRAAPPSVKLTAAERAEVESALQPVAVLNYLFRLRMKANYEDAQVFTQGPTGDHDSAAFARAMINLTSASMLVHELAIMHFIGESTIADAATIWVRANYPPDLKRGLRVRVAVLKQL